MTPSSPDLKERLRDGSVSAYLTADRVLARDALARIDALEAELREAQASGERQWTGWVKCDVARRSAEADNARLSALVDEVVAGLEPLVSECAAEFTVDGRWSNDGQLVKKRTFDRASALLTRAKGVGHE
jgi:multidrug efflux pump subunit AcrA (membrane-fusion protein)